VWILSVPANVRRQISKLPTAALSVEAGDIIEDLAEDPFPADALKMRKYKDHYRIRFGSEAYRIVYKVNLKQRIVTILRVRPGPTAYRGMR
jgi:mRNA-degrading endonuclease RelE of RelBE toxin-antitoxin system